MSQPSNASSRVNSLPRPTSPSPSVVSEKNEEELQKRQDRDEEDRKTRIQLYVFVSRCISYPFNAKQPTDMTRRQVKITRHQLESITSRFIAFLKGDTPIMADEAFQNAVQSYHDVFLKSERVVKMVESGACSQHDFREVFRNNIEKRVRFVVVLFSLSQLDDNDVVVVVAFTSTSMQIVTRNRWFEQGNGANIMDGQIRLYSKRNGR